jgi:hypothetical protein
MVELTQPEAEQVIRHLMTANGHEEEFDSMPLPLQLQAIAGCLGIVTALQELGFRISRPLALAADYGQTQ